jgi:outer membrane murein-binding lipoprotein Lpp
MRYYLVLGLLAAALLIGCTSNSKANSNQIRDLQATIAALQKAATSAPVQAAVPSTAPTVAAFASPSPTSSPTASPTPKPSPSPSPSPSPTAARGTLQPGQPTQVGDVRVTLNSSRIVVSSNQFEKPKAGNQFVAVDLTIENTTNKAYDISSFSSASMLDKDSRKYDQASISSQLNGKLEGSIPPGEKLVGELAFEVPIASAPYVFRFTQPSGGQFGSWVVAPQ